MMARKATVDLHRCTFLHIVNISENADEGNSTAFIHERNTSGAAGYRHGSQPRTHVRVTLPGDPCLAAAAVMWR